MRDANKSGKPEPARNFSRIRSDRFQQGSTVRSEVLLRFVLLQDIEQNQGKPGLVELDQLATTRLRLDATVATLLNNVHKIVKRPTVVFSAFTRRQDALRPTVPWKGIDEEDMNTTVEAWLDEWLELAPQARKNVPLVTMLCWECTLQDASNWVYVKAYNPHEGSITYDWAWFEDAEPTDGMLAWLRSKAGLSRRGPGTELQIWRECGACDAPKWDELSLDWRIIKWGNLGVRHGDVLVV